VYLELGLQLVDRLVLRAELLSTKRTPQTSWANMRGLLCEAENPVQTHGGLPHSIAKAATHLKDFVVHGESIIEVIFHRVELLLHLFECSRLSQAVSTRQTVGP